MDLQSILDANEHNAGTGDASSSISMLYSTFELHDKLRKRRVELEKRKTELREIEADLENLEQEFRQIQNSLGKQMLRKYTMRERVAKLESQLLERIGGEPSHEANLNFLPALEMPPGAGISTDESRALAITFSENMTEWAGENKDNNVLKKFGAVSFHATEVIAGGMAGWLTAFALKTFGKIPVTALGGGLILIQLAHHQGYYTVVNWNGVHDKTQNTLGVTKKDKPEEPSSNQETCHEFGLGLGPTSPVNSRLSFIRHYWSVNTFSVMGFLGGFVYKTYN